MKIRCATIEDLDRITEVEALCFSPAEAASKASFEGRLTVYPNHFWVSEVDDEIVGFVNGFVTDEEDLTDEMFADANMHNEKGAWQMIFGVDTIPEYQRRGIAEQVLNKVIEVAKEEGRKGLVLPCKEHMLHYYAKFGFINEGVSGSEHGGALWYQMRITF